MNGIIWTKHEGNNMNKTEWNNMNKTDKSSRKTQNLWVFEHLTAWNMSCHSTPHDVAAATVDLSKQLKHF